MQYGEHTWKDIANLTDRVVVLPVGSMEQHGHHLPLLTDTMIGSEIIRRTQLEIRDEALFLPMLWVGASDHHRTFPGTVSVSNNVYVQLLEDMIESLIGSGFRRILLVNAHGGNITPGNMALYNVQRRHRDRSDLWLVFSTWFVVASSQIASIEDLEQKHVSHACELETSMILKLYPELVQVDKAHGTNIPFKSAFYSPDSSGSSRISVAKMFEHITIPGALGHPETATAHKGEQLFTTAVSEIVALIKEIASWSELRPT